MKWNSRQNGCICVCASILSDWKSEFHVFIGQFLVNEGKSVQFRFHIHLVFRIQVNLEQFRPIDATSGSFAYNFRGEHQILHKRLKNPMKMRVKEAFLHPKWILERQSKSAILGVGLSL